MEGKLRPIAVLSAERSPNLPSVPTFAEVTGLMNISYAGRTLATAPGLSEDKRTILLDAIKRALANPEYVMKEINNKNPLLFKEGDEMWAALNSSKDMVEKVKFLEFNFFHHVLRSCLLYTSPSPRDATLSRMPSSA